MWSFNRIGSAGERQAARWHASWTVGAIVLLAVAGGLNTGRAPKPLHATVVAASALSVDDAVVGTGTDEFDYQGGGWGSCSNYCSSRSQYLGTEHWDAVANDTVRIAFDGTGISLYTESGPGAGYAAISLDGGAESTVDTYTANEGGNHLVWSSPTLSAGSHTLTVRVTGSHDGAASNSYVLPDRVEIATPLTTTVDDATAGSSDNQFNYQGSGWGTTVGDSSDYNGTHHWSDTVGDSVSVGFTGTQVELYGRTGSGGGIGNISVDGGAQYQVDFYSPAEQGDVALWASPVLPAGHHVLILTVAGLADNNTTGTYVAPDRADILNADTSVDDRVTGTGSGQFDYTGSWAFNAAGGYYDNTHTYTDSAGDTATITFTGVAIDFYGGVGTGGGIAGVSIDGGPEQDVDLYAAADAGNVLVWQSGPLPNTTHSLTVRATGTKNPASTGTWISTDRVDITSDVLTVSTPVDTTNTTTGWGKFVRNPVLGKSYGTAFDTSVLYANGIYKMWFSWRDQGTIAYAQSDDGISWTAPQSVLYPTGSYWGSIVNRPSVIYNGAIGQYQMWYTGQSSTQSWIGYATSTDGLTWTRYSSNPVLSPDASWEGPAVMGPSVLWNPALREYQMWYSAGAQYEPIAIGYATSTDGAHWTKATSNPVFGAGPTGSWDQSQVGGPMVLLGSDGYYYLFYIGYQDINTTAIGIARSADGQTGWQRMPTNPIISPTPGSWDCDADYKPSVVWEPSSQEWKLWYNGRCGTPEQQGLAVHPDYSLGF